MDNRERQVSTRIPDATTAFGNPTTQTAIDAHVKAVRCEKSRAAFSRASAQHVNKGYLEKIYGQRI